MTLEEMTATQDAIFLKCKELRAAGQAEYAGGEDAFGNFNRLAALMHVSREHVLLIYFMKHIDGIFAYVNGHKSQRESVHGRIQDAIVYLTLLSGMIVENERQTS